MKRWKICSVKQIHIQTFWMHLSENPLCMKPIYNQCKTKKLLLVLICMELTVAWKMTNIRDLCMPHHTVRAYCKRQNRVNSCKCAEAACNPESFPRRIKRVRVRYTRAKFPRNASAFEWIEDEVQVELMDAELCLYATVIQIYFIPSISLMALWWQTDETLFSLYLSLPVDQEVFSSGCF